MITYTIHQMAELTGATDRALRYYEEIGLLVPRIRTSGGHRRYTVDDVVTLLRINRLTSLEFTLDQVKTVLEDPEGTTARTILNEVDKTIRATIDRLVECRNGIAAIQAFDGPIDVLPAYADRITELRACGETETSIAIIKDVADLVSVAGSASANIRLRTIDEQTSTPDEIDLERRIFALDENSTPDDIAFVARLWGTQLVCLYDENEEFRAFIESEGMNKARDMAIDAVEASLNDPQLEAQSHARDILRRHVRQAIAERSRALIRQETDGAKPARRASSTTAPGSSSDESKARSIEVSQAHRRVTTNRHEL
jgi:DNA-binding transcriptional MerR regulator